MVTPPVAQSTSLNIERGLARKTLRTSSLLTFGATASSPMAVLAGGIVATYATTGNPGVAASFLLLTAVMLIWAPGYIAIARYVPSNGIFYAAIATGLSRTAGVIAAPVALLAYNTIQISLYGLLGSVLAGAFPGVAWWIWALAGWSMVTLLGVQRSSISSGLLGTILIVELAVIAVFLLMSFSHPAGGQISFDALKPSTLFAAGGLAIFPLGIAAFVGTETPAAYNSEARSPKAVARAVLGGILGLGLLYAICAWAMAASAGTDKVVDLARDPNGGLPFALLDQYGGFAVVALASLMLVTSVLAAMVSFHNSVARYLYSLGRDRLLPKSLGTVREGGSGAPLGGSLTQSVLALAVIMVFAVTGADPLVMFTWLSNIAALAMMLLMAVASLAVVRYFSAGGGRNETMWERAVLPSIGGLAVSVVFVLTLMNINTVLGTPPGSRMALLVPGAIVVSIVIGAMWAIALRGQRPDVLASIAEGPKTSLVQVDEDLKNLSL